MNIRIYINLLLIINLAVINVNCMERKRRSCDDLDLISNKSINLDPDILSTLARAKKEKEAINLDFTKLPTVVQKIIADYLKDDWYIYSVCIFRNNGYVHNLIFSRDNNFLLLGNENHTTIFNILKKTFTNIMFNKVLPIVNIESINENRVIIGESTKVNFIHFSNGSDSYYCDKTYFSKDLIMKGIFSLNDKYLAFACLNFFKIWDISKLETGAEIVEKNCIKTYKIRNEKEERDESCGNNCGIKHLVFSECGYYMAISNGCSECDNICFIYNLKTEEILNLSKIFDKYTKIFSLVFSADSKYLAISADTKVYIFKNRQNGFE